MCLGPDDDDDDDREDDEGLGVSEELVFPVGSRDREPSPQLRPGMELLWWSEEGLVLEAEEGLGPDPGFGAEDEDAPGLGLDRGLLLGGLTV